MRIPFLLFFLPTLFFCRHLPEEPLPKSPLIVKESIDILALGDSYTKGEGVKWEQNFPNQIADSLRYAGFRVEGLHVVAQTGWRTDNLQSALNNQSATLADSTFSLVTLCIGVNNQYQNANFETYKLQFESLLQYAIARAGGRTERVIVISIPDWAYTPYGQAFGNPASISQAIDAYNAANQLISESYGVKYAYVTDISRQGLAQPALVAADGLHPSAEQYTEWLKRFMPTIKAAFKP